MDILSRNLLLGGSNKTPDYNKPNNINMTKTFIATEDCWLAIDSLNGVPNSRCSIILNSTQFNISDQGYSGVDYTHMGIGTFYLLSGDSVSFIGALNARARWFGFRTK